jgi:hypothetical protein
MSRSADVMYRTYFYALWSLGAVEGRVGDCWFGIATDGKTE